MTVPKPEGAFYLFPRIEGLQDSFQFCKDLLLETKVGLAPGVAFGAGGEGSVRICYAAERSILEPAMLRLAGVSSLALVFSRFGCVSFARDRLQPVATLSAPARPLHAPLQAFAGG